jgi:hypothetical protein
MRGSRLVRFKRLMAASLIAALASASSNAQTSSAAEVNTPREDSPSASLLDDRFVVTVGAFVVSSRTNGSLSGNANTSDQNFDFDKQFGTDAYQTRWSADLLWRITPRQHLRLSYFDDDIQHTRTLDQDLPWGDYTFLAGGLVNAQVTMHVYELDYEFAFLRRPNYSIVAVAGIHLDDLTLRLSGNASLTVDTPTGPVEQTASFSSRSSSVSSPLPVFGLRGNWAVSPRVYLDASAQLFGLSYEGINGNWSELHVGATWMFNNHFGVGAGYERYAQHVDLNKLSFSGRLNFGYQGLLLFVKGGF